MKTHLRLLLVISLFTSTFNCAQALQYKIHDLGTIGTSGSARSINDFGQVAGTYLDQNNYNHPFYWYDGSTTLLPSFDGLFNYGYSINNSGYIVGSSQGGTKEHPWLWKDNTFVDLGLLPGDYYGTADDINDNDWVVGTSFTSGYYYKGFVWQNNEMKNLGALGGGNSSASAINNVGQIVGTSTTEYARFHSFLWENDIMTDLGCLPETDSSWAEDINDNGQVVGYSMGDTMTHACLWENGSIIDLGTLGGTTSQAYGINNRGQVVGMSSTAKGLSHACVWNNGVVTDLGTLGGSRSAAYSINNDGWISGYARTINGEQHAVLWEPVPEPSSILTLLLGISTIGFIKTRRK